MPSHLIFKGTNFDVDDFLKQSNLTPLSVEHRGYENTWSPDPFCLIYNKCYFSISRNWDLDEIAADTFEFLHTYADQLILWKTYKLDFEPRLSFKIQNRRVSTQVGYLQKELIALAAKLDFGIELDYCVTRE